MHVKKSSAKWWPFCLGLNMLNDYIACHAAIHDCSQSPINLHISSLICGRSKCHLALIPNCDDMRYNGCKICSCIILMANNQIPKSCSLSQELCIYLCFVVISCGTILWEIENITRPQWFKPLVKLARKSKTRDKLTKNVCTSCGTFLTISIWFELWEMLNHWWVGPLASHLVRHVRMSTWASSHYKDRLIFSMGIPILVRHYLYFETDPWMLGILRAWIVKLNIHMHWWCIRAYPFKHIQLALQQLKIIKKPNLNQFIFWWFNAKEA